MPGIKRGEQQGGNTGKAHRCRWKTNMGKISTHQPIADEYFKSKKSALQLEGAF